MGMASSPSSLEIKVMFGKDLKGFNFFQKLTIYVLVSIVSDDPGKKLDQKQNHRTSTDKEGDGCPEWNHEMRFDLKQIPFQDCDHIFVVFELKHEGVMFGDKPIGEVRVPIKDLISEFNGVLRFMNYEVRNPEGKPNGVLTFSYKVNGMNTAIGTNYPGTPQITGYPTIAHDSQQPGSGIQYPPSLYPAYSSAPESLYPRLEVEATTIQQQSTYSAQDVQYASPVPPQESYYPLQHTNAYDPSPAPAFYPQQPPPTSPMAHDPFCYPPSPMAHDPSCYPPSPMAHDPSCYPPSPMTYPARPSGFSPWPGSPQMGNHSYSMPAGSWDDHSGGQGHPFGHADASSNGGYPYGNHRHSSSWGGR